MKQLAIKRNHEPNFAGYKAAPLRGKDAVAFVALITSAFPVEERDIISHWFRILTD